VTATAAPTPRRALDAWQGFYEALCVPRVDAQGRRIGALMTPAEIDAMEVWQLALFVSGSGDGALHGDELAVANYQARMQGQKLTPASATAHAVHGDAIRAALEAKRRANGGT